VFPVVFTESSRLSLLFSPFLSIPQIKAILVVPGALFLSVLTMLLDLQLCHFSLLLALHLDARMPQTNTRGLRFAGFVEIAVQGLLLFH
jgi:hypothetical protein